MRFLSLLKFSHSVFFNQKKLAILFILSNILFGVLVISSAPNVSLVNIAKDMQVDDFNAFITLDPYQNVQLAIERLTKISEKYGNVSIFHYASFQVYSQDKEIQIPVSNVIIKESYRNIAYLDNLIYGIPNMKIVIEDKEVQFNEIQLMENNDRVQFFSGVIFFNDSDIDMSKLYVGVNLIGSNQFLTSNKLDKLLFDWMNETRSDPRIEAIFEYPINESLEKLENIKNDLVILNFFGVIVFIFLFLAFIGYIQHLIIKQIVTSEKLLHTLGIHIRNMIRIMTIYLLVISIILFVIISLLTTGNVNFSSLLTLFTLILLDSFLVIKYIQKRNRTDYGILLDPYKKLERVSQLVFLLLIMFIGIDFLSFLSGYNISNLISIMLIIIGTSLLSILVYRVLIKRFAKISQEGRGESIRILSYFLRIYRQKFYAFRLLFLTLIIYLLIFQLYLLSNFQAFSSESNSNGDLWGSVNLENEINVPKSSKFVCAMMYPAELIRFGMHIQGYVITDLNLFEVYNELPAVDSTFDTFLIVQNNWEENIMIANTFNKAMPIQLTVNGDTFRYNQTVDALFSETLLFPSQTEFIYYNPSIGLNRTGLQAFGIFLSKNSDPVHELRKDIDLQTNFAFEWLLVPEAIRGQVARNWTQIKLVNFTIPAIIFYFLLLFGVGFILFISGNLKDLEMSQLRGLSGKRIRQFFILNTIIETLIFFSGSSLSLPLTQLYLKRIPLFLDTNNDIGSISIVILSSMTLVFGKFFGYLLYQKR